jgi:hypothetical protein
MWGLSGFGTTSMDSQIRQTDAISGQFLIPSRWERYFLYNLFPSSRSIGNGMGALLFFLQGYSCNFIAVRQP